MKIVRFQASHESAYEEFIKRNESSLFFQSPRYLALLEELLAAEQRTILVLDDSERIVGALPLMACAGPQGRVFNSLPFYGSNGGIIADSAAVEEALIDAYNRLDTEAGTAASTLVTNPLADVDYASVRRDLTDQRIGQFTPLKFADRHAERLMESFHYKTRNMIRKAQKLRISVSIDNEMLGFIADVHRQNMQEIGGQAKSKQFFEQVAKHFRPEIDYRIYIGTLEGEPVAGLLVFYFNKTVEYFTPVVRKEHRETQALSGVIYEAMCQASMAGYSWWNWGGTWTTQEGVYRFKKRWGTLDRPYYYLTRLVNRGLVKSSRGELLDAYPSFFVLPFSALENHKAEA